MNTLLIVDAHAIIHRAFHALPPMQSKDGTPTNAVYGFFGMLDRAIIDFHPTHLVTCFDTPKPTFRKELFKDYQASRPPMQDDLKPQIPVIKELIDSAGIARAEQPGFEADDVIGTLATRFDDDQTRILILTGDRDILQLVNKNIFVITPQTGMSSTKLFTPAEVHDKYQLSPIQIPDYKALAGDSSDNYHAAKGIGPKTAIRLLQQFNTIENLFNNIDAVEQEKIKNSLLEHKEKIILFKQIATIIRDVNVPLQEPELVFKGFNNSMKDKLSELQLFALIKRFFAEKPFIAPKKTSNTVDESQLGLF